MRNMGFFTPMALIVLGLVAGVEGFLYNPYGVIGQIYFVILGIGASSVGLLDLIKFLTTDEQIELGKFWRRIEK